MRKNGFTENLTRLLAHCNEISSKYIVVQTNKMSKNLKSIVFVDNAKEFWRGDMDFYANNIDYIRVPNTSRNIESKYTKDLAKSGNRYAEILLKTSMPNFINKGIDQKIANRLKKWSVIPSKNDKYALFDWDGTISAAEGFSLEVFDAILPKYTPLKILSKIEFTSPMMDFLLPVIRKGGTKTKYRNPRRKTVKNIAAIKYNSTLKEMIETPEYQESLNQHIVIPSKEFLDDMFVYLMRPDRVEMLRDLFQTLLENGVHIHIFTHNPYASTANPYRQVFIEMMWRLFNQNSENQYSKTYKDRHGTLVKIVESSSQQVSIISRDELDSMLHSTVDYTNADEPFLKHNMLRGIGLDPAI